MGTLAKRPTLKWEQLTRNSWWAHPGKQRTACVTPLEMAFVHEPPSADICIDLNKADARICKHDRNPCYLRCGVRRQGLDGVWKVIPYAERVAWLREVLK